LNLFTSSDSYKRADHSHGPELFNFICLNCLNSGVLSDSKRELLLRAKETI